MDITTVTLHLLKDEVSLTAPFLEIWVNQKEIPRLVQDLGKLGRWCPLAVVINDHVVTGLEMDAEGISLLGQPIVRKETI